MKEKIKSIISPKIFLAFCITEILILVTLKILQAIFPYSVIEVPPMFSAILLNALFMLLLVIRVNGKGKDPEITGIPLAVFTTLLADCFLVLLHGLSMAELIRFITPLTANMIGFFIFGIVQVIYAFYLGLTKRRWIVRIGLYLVFIVSVAAAGLLTFDRFIACLSMSQLILNLVYAWSEHRKKRTVASLIFAVGITLFFGCDFCIMLRMLLPPQGLIYDVIRFMVWVFYIPSQAVLTSSYLADKANQ
jgi:hypothetical protein